MTLNADELYPIIFLLQAGQSHGPDGGINRFAKHGSTAVCERSSGVSAIREDPSSFKVALLEDSLLIPS